MIPFLERRDCETFLRLIRVWALLLTGNLLGATIFALALARTPVVDPLVASELVRVSGAATSGGCSTPPSSAAG